MEIKLGDFFIKKVKSRIRISPTPSPRAIPMSSEAVKNTLENVSNAVKSFSGAFAEPSSDSDDVPDTVSTEEQASAPDQPDIPSDDDSDVDEPQQDVRLQFTILPGATGKRGLMLYDGRGFTYRKKSTGK